MIPDDNFINDCVHRLLTAKGWDETERELRDIIADLRATTPPATPLALAPEEREALEQVPGILRSEQVRNWGDYSRALAVLDRLLAASPSQPVAPATPPVDEVKRIANWLDAMAEEYQKAANGQRANALWWAASGIRLGAHRDHVERAATPPAGEPFLLRVDDAFMRRWTERLDANRSEVRRLLEEAGVGVDPEPAKEQTP